MRLHMKRNSPAVNTHARLLVSRAKRLWEGGSLSQILFEVTEVPPLHGGVDVIHSGGTKERVVTVMVVDDVVLLDEDADKLR